MKTSLWAEMLRRPILSCAIALTIGAGAALTVPSSYAHEARRLAQYSPSNPPSGFPGGQPNPGPGAQPAYSPPSGQPGSQGQQPQPYQGQPGQPQPYQGQPSSPPPSGQPGYQGQPYQGQPGSTASGTGLYPPPPSGQPGYQGQPYQGQPGGPASGTGSYPRGSYPQGQDQYPRPGSEGSDRQAPNGQGRPGSQWQHGQQGQPGGMMNEEGMQRRQQEEEKRQQADEKRREEMESRRKEMETKQLEQMKRGFKQMETQITRTRQYFEKQSSKGVAIPTECKTALETIQITLEKAKAAKSFEELQDAGMEDMQEQFQTLNECRMRIEMLARIPQILKQVDRAITQMERRWTSAKSHAPADAADIVSEGDGILQGIKDARKNINVNVTDPEELRETLDEGIFGHFDDMGNVMQRLEAARNAKKFLSFAPRMIRNMEKSILTVKKEGRDVTQLEAMLKDIRAKIDAAKALKPGTEEFKTAVEEIAELGQSFAEAAGIHQEESAGKYFGPMQTQSGQDFSQFFQNYRGQSAQPGLGGPQEQGY